LANHPTDVFLNALKPLQGSLDGGKNQLQILFTQLRIVMDAIQTESGPASPPPASPPPASPTG